MNCTVIGSGAVGLGVGSCLLAAGESARFVTRPDAAAPLRTEGLTRTGIFGDAFAPPGSFEVLDAIEALADTPTDFYAQNISGQQRLPNGNTLICDGPSSYFFEVTASGETVWEYDATGAVFRVERYAPEYPGFDGTPLDDPTTTTLPPTTTTLPPTTTTSSV